MLSSYFTRCLESGPGCIAIIGWTFASISVTLEVLESIVMRPAVTFTQGRHP